MKRFKRQDGSEVILRTPSEQGAKFCNDLHLKMNVNEATGETKPLTKEGACYRLGFLAAQKKSADCYNFKHGLKSKAKKRETGYEAHKKLFGK